MTAFKVLPFFGLYQVSLGAQLKSNIVGGENADQNHWPWMVAIFVKEQNPHNAADTKANFACGGTLIDPKWVLTAAHCVQCLDAKQIRVHVGIYERDDPRNEREVEFFIQHEANAHGIQRNDIALLKLSQPVKDVQLVTLSKASDVFSSNVECRVAGWGNIKQNVPLSKPGKLQELAVPLVNTQTCKESYKDSLTVFDESILCAGLGKTQNQKLSGTCQGDSGGPLMCPNKNQNRPWVQLGIVNQADGCGEKPSIFANVSYYKLWIFDKSGVKL
nr:tryptase-like [Paramormyrops kingsleyae]